MEIEVSYLEEEKGRDLICIPQSQRQIRQNHLRPFYQHLSHPRKPPLFLELSTAYRFSTTTNVVAIIVL